MKLPFVEKNKYTLIIVLGIFLGILLYLGYQNYNNISDWFSNLVNYQQEDTSTKKIYPYFASGVREYVIGDDAEWKFQVFQPEIVEYVDDKDKEDIDTGLNYVILKYSPNEDSSKSYEVKAILTINDDGWYPALADVGFGTDVNDTTFDSVVTNKLRVLSTFDPTVADLDTNSQTITLDTFKSMFPVGSRVAVRVPVSYPAKDLRTQAYCDTFTDTYVYMCQYADVVEKLSAGELTKFNDQKETDDSFILVPFSFSSALTSTDEL